MIESRSTGSHRYAAWYSEEHIPLQHYLIVGYCSKGIDLPRIFSHFGEEVLPVFSSEEAAWEFLSSSSLGKGWCVRGFSSGELVSVIFAFHTSVKGVLLDPQPGVISGDVIESLVGLNAFMSSVLETRTYNPASGARSSFSPDRAAFQVRWSGVRRRHDIRGEDG